MLAVCSLIDGARGIILDGADADSRVLMCDADPATNPSTRDRISPINYLPDLDDPATLGCLLALVREAYDCPSLQCGHVGGWDDGWDSWVVGNPPGRGHGCIIAGEGATEAAALVAALEAAS